METEEATPAVTSNLLSENSRNLYKNEYQSVTTWCKSKPPDEKFLMKKEPFSIGLLRSRRCEKLKKKMAVEEIEDKGSFLILKIPDTKINRK
ncbi:hypothetical protein BDFB_008192 [Asbolus verrucosus]|uniref:Uncharacterized protein n=1 Tax=Asbolus verrucosus TaxID=1661398 RepID=A0A482VXZ6_ASBVE|nr:hypothetical protein BDFB_008192 [Asbolus verrucosus]